ncbi:hypothetical protein HYR99_01050 [Candidatus Poribacteria bacterium]|nr:hypothetical protein [Candidatus Poribacteria bacterium]
MTANSQKKYSIKAQLSPRKDKQRRLNALLACEAGGTLGEAERAALEALFAELDAEEAETMRPALERMQQRQAKLREEKEQLEANVDQLEEIVSEQEQLLTDARLYLNKFPIVSQQVADEAGSACQQILPDYRSRTSCIALKETALQAF